MNESNDEPDAQKSLCWNCKHGMCIRELHQEHLFHVGMKDIPESNPSPGDDPFGMQAYSNQDEEAPPDALEHIVEHEHVRAVCFWRPESVKDSPPLLIGFIKHCNRFEKI